MKYIYSVTAKISFSKTLTSSADSKQEIEEATGISIPEGQWILVNNGKEIIVEDEFFTVKIKKR